VGPDFVTDATGIESCLEFLGDIRQEAGLVERLSDVIVDGLPCFSRRVVALVAGREQWAQQSIMELGVEDCETQPADGQRYEFLPENAHLTSPSGSGMDLPAD
jgi:hypothetical protein